jgi:SAM-dependent methyltransferase
MIAAERAKLDIRNLAGQAALFQHRLDAVRASISNPGFDWYPYDSLGSFHTLAGLLTGPRRFLLDLIGDKPVLDVGCGDGHIAFFLESLGCQVIAVDNPQTNFNRMQGVRALRAALHSKIEIVEQDIDYNFSLPDTQCSVALLLGVLYHLKNPFSILETLLARARYCILSTRVTRLASRQGDDLSRLPVAYLVNETETNNDSTNYWIFTSVGLKRLIERSGWRVVDYATFGNTSGSDPISPEGDERAFCFADRISKPITNGQLAGGWHEQESFQTWRWTERKFSAVFSDIASGADHALRLDFFLPAAIHDALGAVEIAGSINGFALHPETFAKAGHYTYEEPVPDSALIGQPVLVEFTLNKALPPSGNDPRELGLVVESVRLS